MEELDIKIRQAKTDRGALERLVEEYMPFIKKQAMAAGNLGLEYEDKISISMLAFITGVLQYREDKGGFLSYCAKIIKSRLIDEYRKNKRQNSRIFYVGTEVEMFPEQEEEALNAFYKEEERKILAEEIAEFAKGLSAYGISFAELPKNSPKQDRSKRQCRLLAKEVVSDKKLRQDFLNTGRLPQRELAERLEISVKTVEKHRKYIVTLIILLLGNYPAVKAFLPGMEADR